MEKGGNQEGFRLRRNRRPSQPGSSSTIDATIDYYFAVEGRAAVGLRLGPFRKLTRKSPHLGTWTQNYPWRVNPIRRNTPQRTHTQTQHTITNTPALKLELNCIHSAARHERRSMYSVPNEHDAFGTNRGAHSLATATVRYGRIGFLNATKVSGAGAEW